MNTEIADIAGKWVGLVWYDGDCSVCCAAVRRWRRLLASRGFELRPLQSPGAAAQLGLDERTLLEQMQLQLADGRRFGGADALLEIARHFWWAWPLWLVGQLPGAKPILRASYGWLAARRHCIGGACRIPFKPDAPRTGRYEANARASQGDKVRQRHSAFFELP